MIEIIYAVISVEGGRDKLHGCYRVWGGAESKRERLAETGIRAKIAHYRHVLTEGDETEPPAIVVPERINARCVDVPGYGEPAWVYGPSARVVEFPGPRGDFDKRG